MFKPGQRTKFIKDLNSLGSASEHIVFIQSVHTIPGVKDQDVAGTFGPGPREGRPFSTTSIWLVPVSEEPLTVKDFKCLKMAQK